MTPLAFTLIFLAAVLASSLTRFWLASRQIRHVLRHRDQVPDGFVGRISPEAHRRAADYTAARTRLRLVDVLVQVSFVLALTLFGGLVALQALLMQWLPESPFARQLALLAIVAALSSLVELPLAWYRQFRLEQRFGFNRMTPALWLADLAKGAAVAAVLGLPIAALVLWLMQRLGDGWWLAAWVAWAAFNLMVLVLFPTLIAPLFNRFEPLADSELARRLDALLTRCGFRARGVMVMDGSRRSAHGNAYFTGLGAAKRIVLFDTLVARLNPPEIEAVLAHELGHFKHRHVVKRIGLSFALSLAGLALLGWLLHQAWFFQGLNAPPLDGQPHALALVLFALVAPFFTFVLQPIAARASRRHEYEADRFAAGQTRAADLISALVKLYQDNASTLTPDPLHSAFYDSHPPATLRIGRLAQAAG